MAHAVHDFRIFMDYLESRGVNRIGVTGISLGGYTSALLATVEERLHFSIPNVPVVSLPDLVLIDGGPGQLSAAHEPEHIDRAVEAFTEVGRDLGLIE